MKLELIKECKIDADDWYSVYADGKYISGSSNIEKAMSIYDKVASGKLESKIVLKSEEIELSLPNN